jgi:serine/threonine protein kinase
MSDCLTGKYEKVRLLGRGTFGDAYLVISKVTYRICSAVIV